MTKQIIIHNSNQKFVIETESTKNFMFFSVNGQPRDYLMRRRKTNDELIDILIKMYAEPQASVYIK